MSDEGPEHRDDEIGCYRCSSWEKMMEILLHGDAPEREQIAHSVLRLMAYAFREFRKAFAHPQPDGPSWTHPRLFIDFPIPYEWDAGIALSSLDGPEINRQVEFLKLLQLLVAGRALVRYDKGVFGPAVPMITQHYLRSFSSKERKRYSKQWFDREEWLDPALYGNDPQTSEGWTILGCGDEIQFLAALTLRIFPRLFDQVKGISKVRIWVELAWATFGSEATPDEWIAEEREALWETIELFFDRLAEQGEVSRELPETLRVDVRDAENPARRFDYFEARFQDSNGVQFRDKLTPPILESTALKVIPKYALGIRGPVLEISDGKDNFLAGHTLTLLSVMLYPDSELHRQQLVAKKYLQFLTTALPEMLREAGFEDQYIKEHWAELVWKNKPEVDLLLWNLLCALNSAPSAEDLDKEVRARMVEGSMVGEILAFAMICADHHREYVGLRKAVRLTHHNVLGTLDRYGEPVNYGETTLLQYWQKYSNVAHFWAAFRTWEVDFKCDAWCSPWSEDNRPFLALAEKYRSRACFIFGRSRKAKGGPLLDPRKAWRIPDDLALPSITLSTEPLPGEALKILRKYRPR